MITIRYRKFTYSGITQPNRNRLLGTIGVDGLKTGHTEAGGYGIALSAKQGDRRLVLVVNGLKSDNDRIKQGDLLLRWGFREFENKLLVKQGMKVGDAPVWFGKQEYVGLVAAKDVYLTLPVNAAKDMQLTLTYDSPIPAPVGQGAAIATLNISTPGNPLITVPLVAEHPVAALSGLAKIWRKIDVHLFKHDH